MSTPKINPVNNPGRLDITDAKQAKVDPRHNFLNPSATRTASIQEAGQDSFEITPEERRLAEAMDFYPTEEKRDAFTKEKLREIAERIASGFYKSPEVIEAIVEGYRKEFKI